MRACAMISIKKALISCECTQQSAFYFICWWIWLAYQKENVLEFSTVLQWKYGGVTKILGCKSKWMTLSLQPPKAKGQWNKFLAIEVDKVLWFSVFVNVCLVAGYEHCDVYDWRHVWCVCCSSWVNSLWCTAFWRSLMFDVNESKMVWKW